MRIEKIIRTVFIWLPSIMISMIFIQNGLGKIFQSDQMDKIITNNTVIISVGIILLISTALFLFNKTIIWGTTLLVLYMTSIVFIHISKEKPFEVVALVVLSTIFAAYIRQPQLFHQKHNPTNLSEN